MFDDILNAHYILIEGEHIRNVEVEKQASSVEVRGTHHKHFPKAYPDTNNVSLKINWRKQNLVFLLQEYQQ